MRLLFDIEADGLLDTIENVWCMVAIDVDTGKEYTFGPNDLLDGVALLKQAEVLIGHNILGYDLPVLHKMFCVSLSGTKRDTLLMSKLLFPNLQDLDYLKVQGGLPPPLIGRHSLEAWGHRLGCKKIDFKDFSKYSREMLDYCVQDARLNVQLFKYFETLGCPNDVLDLEHDIADVCNRQEAFGFPFNVAAAQELAQRLTARSEELKTTMRDTFEPQVIKLKTKTKTIPFNPASRQQIAERLMARGWKPAEFTESGLPKIDDSVLDSLVHIPEAKLLAEFFTIQKRLGQLSDGKQAWLARVQGDRLHGHVDTLGTGTFRCSHNNPNMAQVPSCAAPFGNECRSLFHAPAGYKLVGVDVAKLELMVLGHYMNDPKFSEVLQSGDVHQLLADVYGTDRRTGKTVTYAFLYGAGLRKLGSIVNPTGTEQQQVAAGKKIHNNMSKRLPSLANLINGVRARAKKDGVIKALDGRRLPVRSEHSALNFLCQSAGAIICKRWVTIFHAMLHKRGLVEGLDYWQAAFVHDEVQVIVREDLAEEIGRLCVSAIEEAGRYYNLRLPITGDFNVGQTWADTH